MGNFSTYTSFKLIQKISAIRFKILTLIVFLIIQPVNFGQKLDSVNTELIFPDSTKTESSLSPSIIGGQLLGGAVSGLIFSLPFIYSLPLASGVGWLIGSSLGVYWVGNEGDFESSFWGTALGGAVGITLIATLFDENEFTEYNFYYGAMLAAIPIEILSYYIFATEKRQVYINQNNTSFEFQNHFCNSDFRLLTKPHASMKIFQINF